MRTVVLVGVLLAGGCQGVVGPLQRYQTRDPVDNPCLPVDEQMRRGRDRLAYPDQLPTVNPPETGLDPRTNLRNEH
jgi:hypothetical protein